jgi:hypothetical protein
MFPLCHFELRQKRIFPLVLSLNYNYVLRVNLGIVIALKKPIGEENDYNKKTSSHLSSLSSISLILSPSCAGSLPLVLVPGHHQTPPRRLPDPNQASTYGYLPHILPTPTQARRPFPKAQTPEASCSLCPLHRVNPVSFSLLLERSASARLELPLFPRHFFGSSPSVEQQQLGADFLSQLASRRTPLSVGPCVVASTSWCCHGLIGVLLWYLDRVRLSSDKSSYHRLRRSGIVVPTHRHRRSSPFRVYNNVAYPSLVLVIDPSPCPDAGSYVTPPTCVHAKNPRRFGAEGNKSVRDRRILYVDGEETRFDAALTMCLVKC